MAYWLEKRVIQGKEKSPQIHWKRYAACGSSELLERVRMGQRRPEQWRVTLDGVAGVSWFPMRKAG